MAAKEASMDEELLNSITIKIIHNEKNIDALQQFGYAQPRLPAMHRVPDVLRKQNEDVYTPTSVSIGPLHKGKEHLQPMEAVKVSYMYLLFDRCTPEFRQAQKDCVRAMREMDSDIQKCFSEVKLDKDFRLAEIILIDACFLIELLYRNYQKDDDPILWNSFRYYAVQRDLLLLENQIPFFVLENLFGLMVNRIPQVGNKPYPSSLIECVLSFFEGMMGLKTEYRSNRPNYHILHLLHGCLLPCNDVESNVWEPRKKAVPGFKYSATQLDIAGVKLKPSEEGNLFELNFSTARHCFCLWQRGEFEIPPFYIHGSTEPLLRNLIAFEQCSPEFPSFFTSYAFLMDILIDTTDDVKLLEEVGIIHNCVGSRDAVLRIFNDICENAVPRHFLYADLWLEVKEFCTPKRVRFRKLIHHYFGNIWIRVSVIGAIFLFILTFLQTFFTIYS